MYRTYRLRHRFFAWINEICLLSRNIIVTRSVLNGKEVGREIAGAIDDCDRAAYVRSNRRTLSSEEF